MDNQKLEEIVIGSLGGTIAMIQETEGEGVQPRLTADDLVRGIPGFRSTFPLRTEAVLQMPSGSFSFGDTVSILRWCREQAAAGARGIVLTQGTDALEEVCYLLDLFWDSDTPLILTGAMRTPASAGADGPANLLAALRVASAAESRGRGVLVVMNDTIHAARWVAKTDTLSVDAFSSGTRGPVGRLVEDVPVYFSPPAPRRPLPDIRTASHDVALVAMSLGAGPVLLEHALISKAYSAVVISAFGAGHVPTRDADLIGAHCGNRPVIICSRCGNGSTARATYGFVGSEIDLARRGAWLGGWLSPLKARILLWSFLAGNVAGHDVRALFETHATP